MFHVWASKSILVIANPICASLQLFFRTCSEYVVIVVADRMGLHGLSVCAIRKGNRHKHVLRIARHEERCGDRGPERDPGATACCLGTADTRCFL
jgi:hypothetical protein